MSFEIRGLEELKKKLSQMEKNLQGEISEKALNKGGQVIENTQKRLAPYKTGELKANLKKQKIQKKKGVSIIKIGIDKNASAEVKAKCYYQNFGSRGRAGLFFMEESMQQSQDEALKKIKQVLKEELK